MFILMFTLRCICKLRQQVRVFSVSMHRNFCILHVCQYFFEYRTLQNREHKVQEGIDAGVCHPVSVRPRHQKRFTTLNESFWTPAPGIISQTKTSSSDISFHISFSQRCFLWSSIQEVLCKSSKPTDRPLNYVFPAFRSLKQKNHCTPWVSVGFSLFVFQNLQMFSNIICPIANTQPHTGCF